MKKKILLLLLGVVFLGGLTISLTKVEAADEQPGDLIFYENNNYIWELSTVTGMKWKLMKGHMPRLSENGLKLAYYDKNMKPAIYDVSNGTHKVISKAAMETANRQPVWSPSGKYLVVNGHTSTNNMFSVITMKGKEEVEFNAVGDVSWINDNELVYISMHEVDEPRPRGDGGGMAFGITKVNVKIGKTTVLLAPSPLIDYQLFDVLNGKIRVIKYEVTEQADWVSGDWTLTYWKMNKSGKNLKETNELVSWSDKILDVLSNKYQDYSVVDYDAYQSTNWRLFTLREAYNTDSIIYMIHYPHKDTLNKIVKGDFPSW